MKTTFLFCFVFFGIASVFANYYDHHEYKKPLEIKVRKICI